MLLPTLENYWNKLPDFSAIPAERKADLDALARHIREKLADGQTAQLVFICTHNSRRSHFAQVWAQIAAHQYGISPVECFSGGTETTACNPRTVAALERAGLEVAAITTGTDNPVYLFRYAEGVPPIAAFSKVYDQAPNPTRNFSAVMTCAQAEENCPFVPGAEKRFALTYEDPKIADGTPAENAAYDTRCRQIAGEMRYLLFQTQQQDSFS